MGDLMTGEFKNTIDEKGRILIPSRLRSALGETDRLIVTRSVERCLWLLLPQTFETIRQKIMDGPGAMFDAGLRLLQRRMIAPAMECDIDKSGRINIPSQLRESVGLEVKAESILLGIGTYLELWSIADYEKFLNESETSFSEASQNLGAMLNTSGR
ncbi:MAG: division/cell wall cluster transcriptional repressor MraZ [Sphaerochaetaceae bacterium]|jgi:MraZ protein|nr:division/cell wall cluster transcriptional repressor MraZ [Sphaerochaetaceae bacterium]MDD2406915.1 division/cell wall cluster transcriptional repressor MraZ [Sphaerochaetaceae bacterium]MDD3670618.1 division/cell wall cluster transcriptional repressor MraZ [Sphaerochaetaceae bacterium]MDD4259110.1 division/cell wall cluster transcriptional repressor MraZ [Sphaerochaetaceae bacterium]MDD4762623.1 division/cell wall cluster transcriptional repressor MraZ [Sphaerochaetaceae bacterium]